MYTSQGRLYLCGEETVKIGVADVNKFKFSRSLIEHWKRLGHEVISHMYNLERHEFCDVVFYDSASANVVYYCKAMKRQKKVIVRAIDIENYMNYYKGFIWDKIDYFIFLNTSQKELMQNNNDFDCPEEKIRVIPPGVNMNTFTLKKAPAGKKAVFVGRGWIGKNVAGAIDVVYELNKLDPGWELHLRCDKFDPRWWKKYINYKIEKCGFPVHLDAEAPDMNQYLEDKDLMIVSSFKEAFSYAAAEAMAKGIPAVINHWYGVDTVWAKELSYFTPSEGAAKAVVQFKRSREDIRKYIEDNYTEKKMLKEMDKLVFEEEQEK